MFVVPPVVLAVFVILPVVFVVPLVVFVVPLVVFVVLLVVFVVLPEAGSRVLAWGSGHACLPGILTASG